MGTVTHSWWESELVQPFWKINLEMHTASYQPFYSWVHDLEKLCTKVFIIAQFVIAIKLETT